MTYEEAWKKSVGWIVHYYKAFLPKSIEYDDYFQECALHFYGTLKPKCEPYACWCYSKVAYKRVMIRLLYRDKERRKSIISLDGCNYTYLQNNDWSIDLKPHLQEVAECIIDGYETDDICALVGKTRETIYSYIKLIKRLYATELGITNYQRKRLRSFTRRRTEKEEANWQQAGQRLKTIPKSKVKVE